MDIEVLRGRKNIIAVICILLGISIFTIVSYTSSYGTGNLQTQITRLLLTCALCFFLFKGRSWAKWITVTLLCLGILIMFFSALASIRINLLLVGISLFYFLFYGSALLLLLVPKSTKSFLEYQRSKR